MVTFSKYGILQVAILHIINVRLTVSKVSEICTLKWV